MCAAVTRALCTAVDHLAAPRHMRLFAHLSLIANYTWQGAQLHGMVFQPSTLTKFSLHDRAAVEPLLEACCSWLLLEASNQLLMDMLLFTHRIRS